MNLKHQTGGSTGWKKRAGFVYKCINGDSKSFILVLIKLFKKSLQINTKYSLNYCEEKFSGFSDLIEVV